MNNNAVAALLGLNILITGGLGALLLTSKNEAAKAPEVKVDLTQLEKPLAKVGADIDQLTSTVQRFSTSYVQYDFLKREMDRLAVIDQTIGVRAQATAAAKNDENAEEADKVIGQLSNLSGQVKGQLQTRRQTMLKLISNLEKQLAQISGTPIAQPQQRQVVRRAPQPQTVPEKSEAPAPQADPAPAAE